MKCIFLFDILKVAKPRLFPSRRLCGKTNSNIIYFHICRVDVILLNYRQISYIITIIPWPLVKDRSAILNRLIDRIISIKTLSELFNNSTINADPIASVIATLSKITTQERAKARGLTFEIRRCCKQTSARSSMRKIPW